MIHTLAAANAIIYLIFFQHLMSLILLIDLDDTLLGNAMDTFVPAYTQALAKRLADFAAPDRLIGQLIQATRWMVQNQDPTLTLEQVFDRYFYPALGFERQTVQTLIDDFYRADFPKLRDITVYKPEAVQVVTEALSQDIQIGIATNPLFPRSAILQRLEWAGFPNASSLFALIPSYETFHFAKPALEYFAEFLGQLGWLNEPVIMVGDDYAMDILPARQMGLPTYWIVDQEEYQVDKTDTRHAWGPLSGLIGWLNQTPRKVLQPECTSPATLTACLRATPAALASLVRIVPQPLWTVKPSPEEWSLTEIVCHLRDVEAEVNLPRLKSILKEQNPFLAGKDTDLWANERNYQAQDLQKALEDFTRQRMELLNLLDQLTPTDWELPARHAIFGPVRLHEITRISADHDRMHLKTVRQLVQQLRSAPQAPGDS